MICDFGLSRIRHEKTRTLSLIQEGGRLRFLAPELDKEYSQQPVDRFSGVPRRAPRAIEEPKKFRTDPACDVYSFAMTLVELITLNPPFASLSSSNAFRAAVRGVRPQQLDFSIFPPAIQSTLWSLMQSMWDHQPLNRPATSQVKASMEWIFPQ